MHQFDIEALTIIKFPDPRLRKPTRPIEVIDERVTRLAQRMLALMKEASGIGLAAPQVGLSWRMFVCNTTGEPGDAQVFVNPRLTNMVGSIESEEGCLSIPGVTVKVRRAARVTLIATDLEGRLVERTVGDLLARCWQHEIDHLDGRLIIDRMSEADRIATRKALKQLEAGFARGRAAGRT